MVFFAICFSYLEFAWEKYLRQIFNGAEIKYRSVAPCHARFGFVWLALLGLERPQKRNSEEEETERACSVTHGCNSLKVGGADCKHCNDTLPRFFHITLFFFFKNNNVCNSDDNIKKFVVMS